MEIFVVANTLGNKYDGSIETAVFSTKEAAEAHAVSVIELVIEIDTGELTILESYEEAVRALEKTEISGYITIDKHEMEENSGGRKAENDIKCSV